MITLYENLRTIVYTPFYLADRRGFWADEGLEVAIQLSPDPVETAEGSACLAEPTFHGVGRCA
jgi:ABC-type nitrate/sulfonate/bicarbonate transport system substrate-binding protein